MAERRSRHAPSSGVLDNGGQSAQFELSAETRGDQEGPLPSGGSVHWDPLCVRDSK